MDTEHYTEKIMFLLKQQTRNGWPKTLNFPTPENEEQQQILDAFLEEFKKAGINIELKNG